MADGQDEEMASAHLEAASLAFHDAQDRQREASERRVLAVIEAREHGMTWNAIADVLGVARPTVIQMVKRYEEEDR